MYNLKMVFNFKVFHHSANGAMNRHFGFQDTLEQKMKKYLSVVIIAIFMISIFSGCGNNGQTAEISGIDNDRPFFRNMTGSGTWSVNPQIPSI